MLHDRAYEKGELIKIKTRYIKKNSNFTKFMVISPRTSWWQRPLQQRSVLRETLGSLPGAPGVQPRAGILQREASTRV